MIAGGLPVEEHQLAPAGACVAERLVGRGVLRTPLGHHDPGHDAHVAVAQHLHECVDPAGHRARRVVVAELDDDQARADRHRAGRFDTVDDRAALRTPARERVVALGREDAFGQHAERRARQGGDADADRVTDEREVDRVGQRPVDRNELEAGSGQVERVPEAPGADRRSVAELHLVGPDPLERRVGVGSRADAVGARQPVAGANVVGIDDAGPAVVRVAGLVVERVVDRRERATGGPRSVRGRELGRDDRAALDPDRAGGVGDRRIGQRVFHAGVVGRRGGDPHRGPSVDLARAGVAGLGVAVAGLGHPVRTRCDGLCPERVHPGATATVTPAGRHLLRHHTTQVALDVEDVDDAVRAADVDQLDGAAVVVDRARVLAHAEHVARRARRLIDRRREHDRSGLVDRQLHPWHGAVLGVEQILGRLRLLHPPQAVRCEPARGLERRHARLGHRPEDAVGGADAETEMVEHALHVGDRRAGVTALEVDEGDREIGPARAPVAARDTEHREAVGRRLGGVERRVVRGVGGGRAPPTRRPGARDHAERPRAVPVGEADPEVRFGSGPGGRAPVVGVEDLLPRLTGERPAVRTPLAEPATVPVADTVDHERDDLVVTRRSRLDPVGRRHPHERGQQQADERDSGPHVPAP